MHFSSKFGQRYVHDERQGVRLSVMVQKEDNLKLKFRKTRLNDFFHYLMSIFGSKCILYEIVEERTSKYNLRVCVHMDTTN